MPGILEVWPQIGGAATVGSLRSRARAVWPRFSQMAQIAKKASYLFGIVEISLERVHRKHRWERGLERMDARAFSSR